jgi:hypothetical protein
MIHEKAREPLEGLLALFSSPVDGNAPGRVDRSEQAKALIPSQAARPTDV